MKFTKSNPEFDTKIFFFLESCQLMNISLTMTVVYFTDLKKLKFEHIYMIFIAQNY